jgi:hypothetical protein
MSFVKNFPIKFLWERNPLVKTLKENSSFPNKNYLHA